MGMFDTPEPLPDEYAKDMREFILLAAKLGPTFNTVHGLNQSVLLRIADEEGNGTGTWYSTFGQGFVGQIERMTPGDLPARVRIERVATKGGNTVKLLTPADAPAPVPDDQDIPF